MNQKIKVSLFCYFRLNFDHFYNETNSRSTFVLFKHIALAFNFIKQRKRLEIGPGGRGVLRQKWIRGKASTTKIGLCFVNYSKLSNKWTL